MSRLVSTGRRSPMLLSFGITLTLLVLGGILGFTADAANYNGNVGGAVNWTAMAWGCGTVAPTDVCGPYPGSVASPFPNAASIGGTGTAVIDTPLANPFSLNTQNGIGLNISVNAGGSMLLSGTSSVTGTSGATTFVLNGGTVTNNGTLSVFSPGIPMTFNFAGGTLGGTGSTNIGTNGTLNLTGTQGPMTINQSITNQGTTTFNNATFPLTMGNGAVFINILPGTFSASGSSTINAGAGGAAFNNSSSWNQNTGGSVTVNIPFNNTGQVNLTSTVGPPTLSLLGGTTGGHSGATWNTGVAGNFNFGGLHQFSNAQTFVGPGNNNIGIGGAWIINTTPATMSLPANLSNSGTINFGATFHTLSVGTYSQTPTGALQMKIGPPNGASDALNVTGAISLSGTLNAVLGSGYTPTNGDTFTVQTEGSRVGDFTTKSLPTYPGGVFQAQYVGAAPETLQLVAAPTVDVTLFKTGPLNVLHNQNVTYTVKVENLSSVNPATAVVITDTFSSGNFVSASATIGTCTLTSPGLITCNIPALAPTPPPAPVFITIVLNANATGSIVNTASLSSVAETDTNSANNTSSITTTVSPASDLSITKTASPNPVAAGGTLTYTLSVFNAGPDPSPSQTVTDLLPAGVTLTSATGVGWTCSGTTTITCTSTTPLNPSTSAPPITITVTAPSTAGPITNQAAVGTTGDPNTANNTTSITTTVTAPSGADMQITKSGPGTFSGSNVTFTITVKNNGPATAVGVVVDDPTPPGSTFVSNSGACVNSFPCSLGTMTPGQIRTINTTFSVPAGTASMTNTATVSASPSDPVPSNNTASDTVTSTPCPKDSPIQVNPREGETNVPPNGTLNWTGVGGTYEVYLGPAGGGCNTLLTTTTSTFTPYSGLVGGVEYESRIVATGFGCQPLSSPCIKWRTAGGCSVQPPTLLEPPNGATGLTPPITFRWTSVAGADLYTIFAGVNGATPTEIGSTAETFFTANVPSGAVVWYVVASQRGCANTGRSANGTFDSCGPPQPPLAGVEGAPISGVAYSVVWDATPDAVRYEVDQAENAQFVGATTQSTASTKVSFTHPAVGTPRVFFYRVRAFGTCTNVPSAYSRTVRVVILPPTPTTSVNVPVGTVEKIRHTIFIPGEPDGSFNFIATTDQPWAVVTPPAGVLPPSGIMLTVEIDPSTLPNGTFTTTVILNLLPISTGTIGIHAVTSKSQPVSVNLVTPVKPGDVSAPTADTLIIPSVGHLAGINSLWRSDIRVLNTASQRARYQLDFITSGATDVKQTIIEVDTNATTALDDIVHNWFGFGEVGDSANGILQIRPLNSGGPAPSAISSSLTTAASSRTYSTSAAGTLGQFIPAVQFERFIGRDSILSLQQIAQSTNYRSNIGVVEAAGKPVSVLISVFNSAGTRLAEVPLDLKAGEQKQLNGFLATQGLTLDDARIEVRVTDGDGKVTAYASVVDNLSIDPLLVSAVKIGGTTAQRYVLPGVADLNTSLASWRTDMRIFNGGSSQQSATITFHPLNNASAPLTASVLVNPGEVRVLNGVLASLFGARDVGGAIHVVTPGDSQLTVTGRTYNQTSNGTFGQFIPAVTIADAADLASRALNILQVEDSVRYRTNVGIAEVTGNSAVVEVTVNLPESKVTPKVQIPLGPNEFRQFAIIKELGLQNVYNARVTVKVISGTGAVTAYGSVIDMLTSDPTYVPAQ